MASTMGRDPLMGEEDTVALKMSDGLVLVRSSCNTTMSVGRAVPSSVAGYNVANVEALRGLRMLNVVEDEVSVGVLERVTVSVAV